MSNTDKQQTTPTTEEQNNTNSTIKNMEDNKWKKWGVILAFIGTLITAGVLIYNANQQHQDRQEEIQLKKDDACRVTVGKKYETVDKVKEKLRNFNIQIAELDRKLGNKRDISVFDENDRNQISQIFNDLTFIHDEATEGKELKKLMEEILIEFYPDVKGNGVSFSSENHYTVTLANISSREGVQTPNTGRLILLENKEKEYIAYYTKFIEDEVQKCVTGDK